MDWKKKLKFVFIVAAFAVLILIVLSNIFKMTQVSEKDFQTYRQGLYYLNKNDLQNAYFNFNNVSKTSALYEIALLRQANCADELSDFDTATKKYRMFIEKYPESLFVQKAYYALAQNYFRQKDFNKAEKTFNDIRKLYKGSEYYTASGYYLGLITKEKFKEENNEKNSFEKAIKAKEHFIEYLKDAPNGRFALNCVNEINSLGVVLNQRDFYLIGQTYFKNSQLKLANESFNRSYMADSWGYLSLIYKKLGQYKKSRDIFEYNYAKYSQNLEEILLQDVIDNYIQIYPQGSKNGLYSALNIARENSSKGEDYILYKLTKIETGEAQKNLYERIYNKFPQGNYASDAVANLFWDAYQNRRYKEAMHLGQIHMRDYQDTLAAPKIMFWTAKLAEKVHSKAEARALYQKLLIKYPDDYYAYRANKHLQSSQNANWKTRASRKLPEKFQEVSFPIRHTTITDDSINLISTILRLNDYRLLGEIDKNNKAVQSWINYKEGKYSTASLLARDALAELPARPDFSDSLYKLAYPLLYQETINDNAKIYKLDSYLVTALIREESYFNPKATSSVGASGLMQLMPATASFIAGRNGFVYDGLNSLYNPEINIKLGCSYLNFAKQQLNENDMLAVASYNGGPNAVKVWCKNLNYKNFDEFIENIPYPETRDYVKKVYRSYWIYNNIY